ncbi:hypothetical protein CHELA1G11_10748 [Hyphomicrobiales bacterium]|nr:hypothetical protein CHELA1G11_10748 [Hyphomicrobiales bacterium]CAH1672520.1 hypothetical protein CHELA1G2_13558 [Hyphomicrobiales bacterium]
MARLAITTTNFNNLTNLPTALSARQESGDPWDSRQARSLGMVRSARPGFMGLKPAQGHGPM